MKYCDSHLLLKIKIDLLKAICQDQDGDPMKLIRKHDKNLKQTGEFSIPSLSNDKAWKSCKMKDVNSNKISEDLYLVKSCQEIGDILAIHLDQKKVIHQYFTNLNDLQELGSNNDNLNVINFDSTKSNSSLLTSARCQLLSECLTRLPLAPEVTHCVSSTFLSAQMESLGACPRRGVQVGPVVGGDGKKNTDLSFEDFRRRTHEEIRQLDEERRDEDEDEEVAEDRLRILTEASIRFSLLGTDITKPVKVQINNQSASFVLYNLARMKQLVRTFEAGVLRGDFPGLPIDVNDINLDLLSEPEEWELMFNFLLLYPDILRECAHSLSLHKLVSLLCNFASIFSRYFSRVKVLKDPLPHLIQSVHAKIFLVKHLSEITIKLLGILNIDYVSKM